MLTVKRVGGLQWFGECVFTTSKRVVDHRKASRRLALVRRVRFVYRKPCRRLVVVRRVRFDHRKPYRMLAVVRRVRFDHRK